MKLRCGYSVGLLWFCDSERTVRGIGIRVIFYGSSGRRLICTFVHYSFSHSTGLTKFGGQRFRISGMWARCLLEAVRYQHQTIKVNAGLVSFRHSCSFIPYHRNSVDPYLMVYANTVLQDVSFIVSPKKAALSRNKPATSGTFSGSQDGIKETP